MNDNPPKTHPTIDTGSGAIGTIGSEGLKSAMDRLHAAG
jgi:hypothetical protein